jgi:hypothetical protein
MRVAGRGVPPMPLQKSEPPQSLEAQQPRPAASKAQPWRPLRLLDQRAGRWSV